MNPRNFYAICIVLLAACNTDSKTSRILDQSLLTSGIVTIQPEKDTVIKTPKGATISIPAGAFATAVQLEIREAYTAADMLLAGLVTESNGQLLKSDGMIYINTVNKEAVKMNKPISIAIPASVEPGMQLYRGEEKADGSVNWKDPVSLAYTPPDTPHAGRRLFWSNCATCHGITKDFAAGPALAGSMKRAPDTATFYAFIKNNPKVLRDGNPYYRALYDKWMKMPMNLFPELTNKDIDQLMEYVEWAAKNAPDDSMYIPRDTSFGPVQQYDSLYRYDSSGVRAYDTSYKPLPDSVQTALFEAALRGGFTDMVSSGDEYTFEIQTLGWYNIDAGMQGLAGTTLVDLKAKLISDVEMEPAMNVYLFMPEQKVLSVGQYQGGGVYHFEKTENKIPLYLGGKAFIIAFGNSKEQLYSGVTGFTTKLQQEINVKLRKITREEFLKQVKELKFEGVQFDVSPAAK